MRFRVSISFFLAVTSAISAQGQARIESVLQPGARVRYLVPHAPRSFTGVVERVETASILVRPDGLDVSIHLGMDSLRSLAVYGGVRSAGDGAGRGFVAGLTIGAVIGSVATTAVWLSSADERCQDCWVSSTGAVAVLSVLGSLGLGLLGGVLGGAAPGELWHDVPLRKSRP